MKYRLIVKKVEPNENFTAQKADWEEKNRWGRMDRGNYMPDGYPLEEITTDALIVELTEEQFRKLKEESFKAFQ